MVRREGASHAQRGIGPTLLKASRHPTGLLLLIHRSAHMPFTKARPLGLRSMGMTRGKGVFAHVGIPACWRPVAMDRV